MLNLRNGNELVAKASKDTIHRNYGPAITYSYMDKDGRMWVSNDEYTTQVNFCPFSGVKAKVSIGEKLKTDGNT